MAPEADAHPQLQQREDYQSPISGVVDKRLMDINEDRYVEKRQKFKAGRCQAVHIFPLALGMMPEDDTSSDEVREPRLAVSSFSANVMLRPARSISVSFASPTKLGTQ